MYVIMYNGNIKFGRYPFSAPTSYYLAITKIFAYSLGGIMILSLVFTFVNVYMTSIYSKIKSKFLSLVINLFFNILIYSLFLFKFYGMFTSLVDEELLGKTFDNAPPNTDMNWHINFCNKVFLFIYSYCL